MRGRFILSLLGAMASFAIGFRLGTFFAPIDAAERNQQVTCRPTSPELLTTDASGPVVLLWGNSLLFDYNWSSLDAFVVNCAHQGLRARAAEVLTSGLPAVAPDVVVLTFGTVEAVSFVTEGEPEQGDDFRDAIRQIVENIRTRWPGARIVLTSVPSSKFSVVNKETARRLNVILTETIGTVYLDLDSEFGHLLPRELTYDGVHLTERGYLTWVVALDKLLGRSD